MGYANGIKWDDKKICNAIKEVVKIAKIDSMPTQALMKEITGSFALSCAISKRGGSKYWAKKLGLKIKTCESKIGYEFECKCLNLLRHLGYRCEFTSARFPYDLLVENNIKIDVKCSNLYQTKQGNYYTFNLEKKMPTCDIFVCYCIKDEAQKIYIIPSCVLSGKTQLSIGENHSKYDKYVENWQVVRQYDEFYRSMY